MFVPLLTTMLCAGVGAEPLVPGDHVVEVTVGTLDRTYRVHVPPAYDAAVPTPVVVIFHGGGGNAAKMARFSGLDDKADEAGFLAVYPEGTGRFGIHTFNGGNCCGYAMRYGIDDIEFTRRLLDDLAERANVDPKRVYATGMSNGAIMTYLVASELADRFAAVAPVSGPMGTETCDPSRPVPILHFHGTADENARFEGGKGVGVSGTDFYSVQHSLDAWVAANGCETVPVAEELPDRFDDGTRVVRKTYGSGRDGSEVVLILIEGGGHTWPGRETRLKFLGRSTREISANDLLWDFFVAHPMP